MRTLALYYLSVMNLAAFALYGLDKGKAIRKRWRIPERHLIGMAWAGGAAGALLGMLVFHHKIRKWKFRILVPLAVLVWGMLLAASIFRGGII